MRCLKMYALILLSLIIPIISGCGSSTSAGGAEDPFGSGGKVGESPAASGGVLPYKLTLLPGKEMALANEEMIVTAILKDTDNNPIANQLISFSITAGPASVLTNTMRTDSNGIALAFIRTGTTSTTTNVIIQGTTSSDGSSATGYGSFQVSPVDATQVDTRVSLSLSSFTVKPNDELVVTAKVQDAAGNPIGKKTVNFSISAGPASMLITTATTDSNGLATALIKAGNPAETANVIVQAVTTVNTNQIIAVIPFQIVPKTVSSLAFSMTMVPSKQIIDNIEEFYVTALLQDSSNIPVINQPITFTVATGPATVNTVTVNTDSTGRAIATVRAGNPGSTMAIIIQASTTINGIQVTALAPVQIITKALSESVLKMVLKSDKESVGISGDVLLTATITDMQSPPKPVQNQPINFSIVAGPARIIDPAVISDSAGKAVSRLKVDTSTNSSANIIVMASTEVNGVPINAYVTIYVIRQDGYVINFLTSRLPSDPDGNLNTMSATIAADSVGYFIFKQLVPFQVLDNNGVPEPNVDVSIEVFNYGRNPDTIIQLVPPYPGDPVDFPASITRVTVRTDDHGMGIFLCNVWMIAPGPGGTNTESIIYQATATIMPDNINLLSYGGFIATIKQKEF